MAAAIEQEFGEESDLVGGGGGIFAVELDGALVFRNDPVRCGVPGEAEVIEALRGLL